LGGVLETQSFGRLGGARVPEVVDHVGHLCESLTCLERLRRLAIVYNTFNVQRHLTSASTHRGFRAAADTWRAAVAVA
jgi:hypothetical protein